MRWAIAQLLVRTAKYPLKEKHAMKHHDDASFDDVLAQLGDGGFGDLFRRLLERGMQELIDVELT